MEEVAELRRALGIGKEREMAPPSPPVPMLQSWEDMLNKLKELSVTTVTDNLRLERRVKELEEDLQVWKQARTVEKKQHEDGKLALQNRLKALESMQDSQVLCVLDGDGNIFADEFLRAGLEGGREAARSLTSGLWAYLKREGYDGQIRHAIWLSIYFNKKGLQDTLVRSDVCSVDQFESFLVGISQASPRFLLIDVGYGKDAADAKIKEYLQTNVRFPQTCKVFFGGGHDNGYLPTLSSLANEGLLDKIVLLTGYRETAAELKALNLQTLTLDHLFRNSKLPTSQASRVVDIPLTPPTDVPMSPPGLTVDSSPQTISSVLFNNDNNINKPHVRKTLDPSLALTKQNPPPCNEFYILGRCPRGETCKYCHDYELNDVQKAKLASHAKNGVCPSVKKGVECLYGFKCIWGHTCPKGPECFFYRQGKCWFNTAAAHGLKDLNGETGRSPASPDHIAILEAMNRLNLRIAG